MDLGGLAGRGVDAGADRPDRLVGEHAARRLLAATAGRGRRELALDHRRTSGPARARRRVSPTQRIGVRPCAERRRDLARRTCSSVSPKSWRRSEWPRMHEAAAERRRASAARSRRCRRRRLPVAVLGAEQDGDPASTSATAASAVNGGHTATSTPRGPLEPSRTAAGQRPRLGERAVHLPVAGDERGARHGHSAIRRRPARPRPAAPALEELEERAAAGGDVADAVGDARPGLHGGDRVAAADRP